MAHSEGTSKVFVNRAFTPEIRLQGAKVNLDKTLDMPLERTKFPEPIQEFGCDTAEEGRAFKYLGIVTGMALQIECVWTRSYTTQTAVVYMGE
ncbi:hypothetical protein R1sor_014282 [Riccia sorocarpa]|uniref:Uncharacterized protein n=1 Tax=Riccia sorocarpa TaxID=122646 RepID=A0ABD3H972_9MARC